MTKSHRYTEKDLEALGLVLNADGTWSKPKIESPFMKQQKAINEGLIVEPREIEVDVILALKTEWFIKSKQSVPSKKNSRINLRNGMSIPSKKHAEYVQITALQYDVFGREFRNAVKVLGLEYPLKVEFTFVRATKHSFDYCNACQTCEDIMKDKYDKKGKLIKLGWFPDDSADYIKPSFGDYEYDKNNAGVKIRLLK